MKLVRKFVTIIQLGSKTGEGMENVKQVLNAAVYCCTAKATMEKVVEYMQSEPMNLVEMVTMQTLLQISGQEDTLDMSEFDLVFAGNKEVLETAGIKEARYLKEADELLFVKMFLRYLHKNQKKVFVLADQEMLLNDLLDYAKERYSGIKIVGTAVLEDEGISDDMIINMVNGTETDCIMAFLPSPKQEEFALRNKALFQAHMWLGLGNDVKSKMSGIGIIDKFKNFLAHQFLKNKMKEL